MHFHFFRWDRWSQRNKRSRLPSFICDRHNYTDCHC